MLIIGVLVVFLLIGAGMVIMKWLHQFIPQIPLDKSGVILFLPFFFVFAVIVNYVILPSILDVFKIKLIKKRRS